MENEKPATVSVFEHENAMMHMDRANERMKTVVISVCIAFVLITIINVAAYTIRTQNWLNTLTRLLSQPAVTEVAGSGVYQQPNQSPD